MPRKSVPALSTSSLFAFAGFAAISTACVAFPMQPAIREHAVAKSQMDQRVSAISNTVLARRAHSGVDGGSSARHVRRAFGNGHMSSGFADDLVGGTFAWPYFNYCRRHNADPNC
jgi:hypothetical protein